MPIVIEGKEFLTVQEAARRAKVGEHTIRNRLKDGRLKGQQFSTVWGVDPDSLAALFGSLFGDNGKE